MALGQKHPDRIQPARKHGCARKAGRSPEYQSWLCMRGRCYQLTNNRYHSHGGRGIVVCERWKCSFKNFLADMGPKPSPKHQLDRIDNDGDYEPGNCRWVTPKEQSNNTRRNRYLSEWATKIGIERRTIAGRIDYCGWSVEAALTTPVSHHKQVVYHR